MAATEPSTGASMKAEKANRESLAKKKSAIRAELEKTAAELEEIEQLKAEAEDLEDEEMLNEMQAEEQRLQGLKQQYTAELESIQQQQAAAQLALRQRFKRLTGDRAASLGSSSTDLGASSKSTFSESETAQPAAGMAPAAIDSPPAQAFSTAPSSTYIAQPYSPGTQGVAADTAQPAMPHTLPIDSPAMSNQPLSASWGAAPLQTTALDQPPTGHLAMAPPSIVHSSPQHAELGATQPAQQQPGLAQAQYPTSSMPQDIGSPHVTATTRSAFGDSNNQLDSSRYSQQTDQEPVAQSTSDMTDSAGADQSKTEAVQSQPTSLHTAPASIEAEGMSRNVPDLSKPPRPALNSAGLQGLAKTGTGSQQPSGVGMLHDRSGSKASMMSAGSGYQADSDSNSDVPVDPQTAPANLSTPPSPTRTDTAADAIRTRGAHESSESEGRVAETGAESKEKPTTPSSMLGRIGDTVWGAVEAITGHTTEPSGENSKASAQTVDAEGLHAESSPAASQSAGADTLSQPAAVKEAELTQADSGYEAGEEGPVQAAPDAPLRAAPVRSPSGLESEHSLSGFTATPPAIRTNTESQQDSTGASSVGMQQPQDADSYAESAAESGGTAGSQQGYSAPPSGVSQEPLHVHTDPASSKRGISGLGSEQPGSASKRPRGESTVAKLINTFDSPMSDPISPSLSSRGSGSAAGRKFFTAASFNEGQGGFTQGIGPAQGRAASSSLASNQGGSPFADSTTHGSQGMQPAGSRTLGEEDSYLQSTKASQGSMDPNRDLAVGSIGSISNQSELTNRASGMSHTQPLSPEEVPDSAAELAHPTDSTAGMPAGTAAMSSLPPSASWGAAPDPSPTPAPTPAVTEQPAVILASKHSVGGLAEAKPEHSASTHDAAQGVPPPSSPEADFAQSLPESVQQEAAPEGVQEGFIQHSSEHGSAPVTPQDAFSQHSSFEPGSATVPSLGGTNQAAAHPHDGAANQNVVEAPHRAEQQGLQQTQPAGLDQTAQDSFAAQAAEKPTQRDQPTDQAQGAQTSQTGFGKDSMQEPAQHEQAAESASTAQRAVAAPMAQDGQAGFTDDVFAQFSPLTSRSRQGQQANPFASATVVSPVAQEPALESVQPVEPSMQGQVMHAPLSAAGSYSGRTPFQSGRPGPGVTERLDTQQSLDISSGKASPRRKPPPPPQRSQSGIGRTSSTAPLPPTQTPRGSASPREGMQQPAASSLAGQQEARPSLFAGRTAFDEAVKADASAAPQASAPQSAFGTAGTGPDLGASGSQAGTAPKGEPLASWYSFEDPGPLPPMPTPTDPQGQSNQVPTSAPKSSQPATSKQPEKQASIDPWAAPVEPSAEVKASESEVMAASFAGLEGDAWGGNTFGQDRGQLKADAEPIGVAKGKSTAGEEPMGRAMDGSTKESPTGEAASAQNMSFNAAQDSTAVDSQAQPLKTQPSWMQLANSSNPFSHFIPLDNSSSDPNPWAATPTPTPAGSQQFPAEPLGSRQETHQDKPADFGSWNTFDQPGPVAYPTVDNSRHPDASARSSHQPAAATTSAVPQQQQQNQQYPAPPTGVGAQQPTELDWAAFGGGDASQPAPQQQQQPAAADDIWSSLNRNQQQPPQQKQEPRAAIVDSWASFDAPSDAPGLGAPVASQQASQGMSNVNSQDSWGAFDASNGSRAGAAGTAGFPTSASQQPQGVVTQPTPADRKSSVEEIPAEDLGLEGLRITAQPKPGGTQGYGYFQEGGSSQGPAQPLPKPKRGSSNQFGSVFAPGSANSVSKLTNMFKKDKDKKGRPSIDANQFEQQGAPTVSAPQSSQAPAASLPPTPQRAEGQGEPSEVDLWRPQSTQERQQCMDAFDHKGYGRLGGLGEVEARALWTRQNMPPDSFRQVWHLSDLDSNQLLSKPEFCLFMYLMHALRNFGASFRLPEHITPAQAARILGLEGMVRGAGGSGPPPQLGPPSSQGQYNPAQAYSGNGGLQGPQQYPPQQGAQQTGASDWEATGGLSPSQQQAVQEMTALGFGAQQSQEALEAHRWNRNAAANWLLQGGSSQPQGGSSLPPTPRALRRSTTERSSYVSGSGGAGQSLRHSGSGIGRFNHGHTSSTSSTADWGSGNYSPTSTGGYSQPGSARTTGDSIPGSGVQFGSPGSTPKSSSRVPATGSARLSLTVRRAKMDYRGAMEKPFFTLSIRARGGTQLELSQDTPPGMFANGVMHLDQTLVLSTPIAEIPQGSVLFFELKHWKPRDKKFSLRGWALVAVSSLVDYSGSVPQLQTGTMKLSMLQKPVDLMLSRKHKRLSPEGFDLEVNVNIA